MGQSVAIVRTVPAAGRRPVWLWRAGIALIVAVAAVLYIQPWTTRATAVLTETVVPGPLQRVLAINGRIDALRSVTMRSGVGGTIAAVMVDDGDVVAAGDMLATLDAAEQQAGVRQALAALDAALVAQAQAQATRQRTQALGSNVARNALADADLANRAADQEVTRQTALFNQARIEVARHIVTAPMAGTIVARHAEPGQVVGTMDDLFTLADLSSLIVEAGVDEAYATQVAPGLPAVLRLVGEDRTRPGRIASASPDVDPDTGARAVKIAFDEPVDAPIGLTFTANIVFDSLAAAISVPRAAIVAGGGAAGQAVFVVVDGKARRRPVTVLAWPADRLIVTTGLAAGDVVITEGTGLMDGEAVAVASVAR